MRKLSLLLVAGLLLIVTTGMARADSILNNGDVLNVAPAPPGPIDALNHYGYHTGPQPEGLLPSRFVGLRVGHIRLFHDLFSSF